MGDIMTEGVIVKYTTKEEAIKAHPNLSYEFNDVRKAATVAFFLALLGIVGIFPLSEQPVEVMIIVLFNIALFIGLAFLIFHKSLAAVKYYLILVILSDLSTILGDIAQDNFSFILMIFQLIPMLIVLGLIQPAYSSIIEINKYVENSIEGELYFRVIKYLIYGLCWIVFGLLALAIMSLLGNL